MGGPGQSGCAPLVMDSAAEDLCFSKRDGSSVCGWRESRGQDGLRGADPISRSSVRFLVASG